MPKPARLTRALLLRLSDDLHARVTTAATDVDSSAAGWVRGVIAHELRARAPRDLQRSPPRAPRPVLSAAQIDAKSVVRALGVVGGATVMLCKNLREGQRVEHAEAEAVLRELRAVSAEARATLERLGP